MYRSSLYVPRDLWERAKEYAHENGYTGVSEVIREFLRDLIEEEERNEQS